MGYDFVISKLDIRESYFLGKVKFNDDEYTLNIQTERRGKILKPIPYTNIAYQSIIIAVGYVITFATRPWQVI